MAKRKSNSVKKKATFSHRDFVMYVLVFALVGAFALWVSLAAPHKGGNGGGGNTLSLVLSDDLNNDGLPNYNDTITYSVSSGATSAPSVKTACYQNGVLVLHADASFYSGNPFAYQDFLKLTSGAWTGGSADCTATMYYNSHNKQVTLATLSFHVNA